MEKLNSRNGSPSKDTGSKNNNSDNDVDYKNNNSDNDVDYKNSSEVTNPNPSTATPSIPSEMPMER